MRLLLAAGFIAVLATGLWAWSHGLQGPYHFDDYVTPVGDPASQSLSAWWQHLPVTLRPLTKLTYALEAEASVTDTPAARHGVSILLHCLSASLLLLLIRRLTPMASWLGATVLAAIWFLHPVHADGVLLVSGRTAVLANLFVLAALLAFERARGWCSAFLFALACFSRETAIAALLPLMVLAAARHPGQRWIAIRSLVPLLVTTSIILCWILTTPRYRQLADFSMLGRPIASSIASQVGAVPVGLALLSHPTALSVDYGIRLPVKFTEPLFVSGVLLYVAAVAGIFVSVRRSPAAAVGLALWLAALLPTQSVIPKLDALANRPLTLALAGLLLAASPLLGRPSLVANHLAVPTHQARPRWAALAVTGVGLALVGALAIATSHRAALFRAPLLIWQDAAAKSLVNERPWVQYAVLLQQHGRSRDARAALAVAAGINPFNSQIAAMSRVLRPREVFP